jgi:hypothetical protein
MQVHRAVDRVGVGLLQEQRLRISTWRLAGIAVLFFIERVERRSLSVEVPVAAKVPDNRQETRRERCRR